MSVYVRWPFLKLISLLNTSIAPSYYHDAPRDNGNRKKVGFMPQLNTYSLILCMHVQT